MRARLIVLCSIALLVIWALSEHVLTISLSQRAVNAQASTVSTTSGSITAIDKLTEQAYASASKSVVYVVNAGVGSGSGIIYDAQGDIVTNDHVVSGATNLSVTLNDGTTHPATIVGTDPADDLAVIRIHASNLTPARFAAAGSYQIGQSVLAIGSPLGLKQSVTSGLISGLHRVEQEQNGAYLSDALQTSAPINPGNSGGALVALDGTVVGMPTLEQTSSTSGESAQNIGFAIPSDRIVTIANQLVQSGKVQHTGRPYLGISPTDATGQSGFGGFGGFGPNQTSPTVSGALVARISSSGPAARAGVQQGDIITSIDGTPVTNAQDLLSVLATKKPCDTVSLTLNRNGATVSVRVHLGELPA